MGEWGGYYEFPLYRCANDLAAIDKVIAKDLAIDGIIPRSYIEKKTRHILQPLLSIKNNWLSSMSVSLL